MTNPSPRDSAARKVVSAARAIVAHQIGFSAGCQRMRRALLWLDPYESNLPNVFQEYMDATRGLPIGSERLEWDRNSLREKDVELVKVDQRFQPRIMEACWNLIDRFSKP